MVELRRTAEFDQWLAGLRDHIARARIMIRIDRLALGNAGDAKGVGEGISELRIAYGPGYRVYFVKRGEVVVILLCGDDKSSQSRDIARAKILARTAGD